MDSDTSSSAPPKKQKKDKKKDDSTLPYLLQIKWVLLSLFVVCIAVFGGVIVAVDYLHIKSSYAESRLIDKKTLEIGSGSLKLMWATPIFTINLHNNSRIVEMDFNATHFNSALHAAVVAEFGKFLRELEARDGAQGHSKSGSSSRAYNELFFAWQRDAWENNGRTVMDKYSEFVHLKAIMKSAATTYLDMTGHEMPEHTEMFCWATIHRECMFHLPHTHPLNLVSGVYYARVPDGAGDIVFHDPRGPLPPFDAPIIYGPKEGDLIVFPSWLLHQVSPTLGDEERISFSFNIPGDWTQTADVSLTIPFM